MASMKVYKGHISCIAIFLVVSRRYKFLVDIISHLSLSYIYNKGKTTSEKRFKTIAMFSYYSPSSGRPLKSWSFKTKGYRAYRIAIVSIQLNYPWGLINYCVVETVAAFSLQWHIIMAVQ